MALPTIACMVLYKNERVHLERIAEKILSAFDEAIFVTNEEGSTDGSEDYLNSLGIEPLRMKWVESFAAGRQVGLDHSTSDYTLWMDCDDDLHSDLGDMEAAGTALRQWLKGNPSDYYWHRVYHADRRTFWVRENLFHRDTKVHVRYPTHEVYEVTGRALSVPPGMLDRVNDSLKPDYAGKSWRYFDMLHKYLSEVDATDCRCRYYLASEFHGPDSAKVALYLDYLSSVKQKASYRNFAEEWCSLFALFQRRAALDAGILLEWSEWLLLKYPFQFLSHFLDAMIRCELDTQGVHALRMLSLLKRKDSFQQEISGWFRGWYFDKALNACGYYLHRASVREQDRELARLSVEVLKSASGPSCLKAVQGMVKGNLAMAQKWFQGFDVPEGVLTSGRSDGLPER